MITFYKLLLSLLATLSLSAAAVAHTAGEIATTEALLSFRASRQIVWQDPQTGETLQRRKADTTLVLAAKDDDIAPTLANAGTIMGGYLANAATIPAATTRPDNLIALVANPTWNRLFTLASSYRRSTGNIMRDCFGGEIYSVAINEQIDRMRHSATRSMLERRDVIVVASVSCIYGIGGVNTYSEMTVPLKVG